MDALPRLLGGVRIAATWAFIAAVFAEYAGSDAGLGYLIARGTPTFDTSRVYAAILILTVVWLLYILVMSILLLPPTGKLPPRLQRSRRTHFVQGRSPGASAKNGEVHSPQT